MKISPIFILFFTFSVYGQQCSCSQKPELKDVLSCEATLLQNGAKIYWEYDCNSSWITFQKGKEKRKIFELEKEFIALSGKLGYRNWTEYKNSFLIENSLASGCCQPAEYILYDKNNGRKITELGTVIFISDTKDQPYTVTLKNNHQLLYTNLNNNRSYPVKIPENLIENTLKNSEELYPENLFESIHVKNKMLFISLRYKESKKADWKVKTITRNIK